MAQLPERNYNPERYASEDLGYTVAFSDIDLGEEFIVVYGENYFYEKDVPYLKVKTNIALGTGNALCWNDYTVYKFPDYYRVIAL